MATYGSYKDSGVKWLGQIPSHWEVKKLRAFFDRRNQKVSDKDFAPLSVTKNGVLPQMENVAKSKDSENRRLVKKGDFVINSRSDRKGSSGVSLLEGSVSFVNTIMTPHDNIISPYSNYLLKSYSFVEENYRNGHGIVADLWTTSFDEQKHIYLAVPSVSEQDAIVKYLDKVTVDIDRAIEAQQKLIDALNQRKQIIITNAVTKGLNPDAPLRDSGIDWLGQIPQHWKVIQLRRISKIKTGKTPPTSNPDFYENPDITWYTPGDFNLSSIYLKNSERKLDNRAKKEISLFPKNSVLMVGIGGTLGKIGYTDLECFSNQQINAIIPDKNCDGRFLAYFLSSISEIIKGTANAATLPILNQDCNKRILVLLPPKIEQQEIISFIEMQISPLEDSISNCEKLIALLQERKQIIINEMVTGKKKVI